MIFALKQPVHNLNGNNCYPYEIAQLRIIVYICIVIDLYTFLPCKQT